MGKKKCPRCNGCMIQVYRANQLFWHCGFCRLYYKALPQGRIELIDIKEFLKLNGTSN